MSHENPHHDPENERQDDDLRRTEEDARSYADDEAEAYEYESARECSLRTAEYADKRIVSPPRGGFGSSYGPDIGVDGSFGYREQLHNAQIRANIEYSESQKARRK